ncbi:MAG: hypothetical protein WC860_06850, partial [Candidatus Margulisiibacteriota bacterium]
LINQKFWENPLNEITASISANIKNYTIYQQHFETLDLDFLFNKGEINLNKFSGQTGNQWLSVSGILLHNKPYHLIIKSKNLEIENSLIKQFLPPTFKNIQGYCDLDIKIKQQKTSSLFPYIISGNIILKNSIIFDQYLKLINCDFLIQNNIFFLNKFYLEQDYSSLNLEGKIFNNEKFNINITNNSRIDFTEFPTILNHFGKIKGVGLISGNLQGTFENLIFDIMLDIDKPKYNLLSLDHLSGQLNYTKKKIFFNNMVISKTKDLYTLSGYFDLSTLKNQKKDFEIDFKIIKGDLPVFTDLITQLNNELVENGETSLKKISIKNNFLEPNEKKTTFNYSIKDQEFNQNSENISIYKAGSLNSSFILINSIKNSKKYNNEITPKISNHFSGNISGEFKFKNNKDSLFNLYANFSINNLVIGPFKAKEMMLTINDLPVNSKINFKFITATFGEEKITSFNLDALLNKNKYNLIIKKTEISSDSFINDNFLTGTIPLTNFFNNKDTKEELALDFNFKGNDIGIVTLFIPFIKKVSNEGQFQLTLTGSLKKPVFNCTALNLKKTKVKFNDDFFIKSFINIDDNKLIIQNNNITIPNFSFSWQGQDTKSKNSNNEILNNLTLNGAIDLKNLNLLEITKLILGINLSIDDTKITVNYPNFYNGDIILKNIKIKGDYIVPLSEHEKNI